MTTHKILQGDVKEVQKTLPDNSVNLIVTSPPYNVGIDYGNYKDNLPLDQYIEFLNNIFTDCIRLLSGGGHLCINIANTGRQPYTPKKDFIVYSLIKSISSDVEYRGEVIWDKQNITSGCAWGSWKSPNCPSLRDEHEYIIVFRKNGNRKGVTDITSIEFMEFTKSIWRIPPETCNPNHPAPYPEELVYRLIKLYSFKNETVYDPFLGSGTTSVVAKKLGRNSIGIELNPAYIKMAQDRLNRIIGQEQTISKINNTVEI